MKEFKTATTGSMNGDSISAGGELKSELGKDDHDEHHLLLTPRTEASTPESEDYHGRSVDEDDEMNPSTKSLTDEVSESSVYEEQGLHLQRHMSQTDNHIHLLDRNGDLNEVAGSQSMLSQELIDHGHDHNDESRDEESSNTSTAPCLLEDLGLEKGSKSESSVGIAKRLGLLPQTQDEEGKYHGDEVKPARNTGKTAKKSDNLGQEMDVPSPAASQSHLKLYREEPQKTSNDSSTVPKSFDQSAKETSLSGLELLTQVGINRANEVAAIKSKSDNFGGECTSNKAIAVDATGRNNEGFGCLLDAVAKFTEQEKYEADLSMEWVSPPATTETPTAKQRGKKRKSETSTNKSKTSSPKVQRKSETQKLKEKVRREKIEQENERAQAIAKRAAIIAERTITDPIIAKKLLLSMALARENPRSVPQNLPGKGHVVQKSFFWAHYPPLELVLKKHMAEYYELSTHQCQSRQQQAFNNYMVGLVKDVAERQEWKFADSFCDKSLRDRIRCYYKTHIQNAKKRLRTMVRNPTKKANARHLCEHLDLIEKHCVENDDSKPKAVQPN